MGLGLLLLPWNFSLIWTPSRCLPTAGDVSPHVLSPQPCSGPHMGLGFPGDGTWSLTPFMVLLQIYGYDELQMLQSRLPVVSGL